MPPQRLQDGSVIRLPGVSIASGRAPRPGGLRDLPLAADRLDDLLFLMNELVTNSFFHSTKDSKANIDVLILAEAVRVEVRAGSLGDSAEHPLGDSSEDSTSAGWALAWLNDAADRWGAEDGAACVWFEIDRPIRAMGVPEL